MKDIKIKYLEFPIDNFQLTEAAQNLSNRKVTQDHIFSPPDGWPSEFWEKECNRSYLERVSISSVLLKMEVNRIQDLILEIGEDKLKLTKQI